MRSKTARSPPLQKRRYESPGKAACDTNADMIAGHRGVEIYSVCLAGDGGTGVAPGGKSVPFSAWQAVIAMSATAKDHLPPKICGYARKVAAEAERERRAAAKIAEYEQRRAAEAARAHEETKGETVVEGADPVVAVFLASLDLSELLPRFVEESVDADVLPCLTAEDLAAMGVRTVSDSASPPRHRDEFSFPRRGPRARSWRASSARSSARRSSSRRTTSTTPRCTRPRPSSKRAGHS